MIVATLNLSQIFLRTRFGTVRTKLVGELVSHHSKIEAMAHMIRAAFQGSSSTPEIVIYQSNESNQLFVEPQSIIHPRPTTSAQTVWQAVHTWLGSQTKASFSKVLQLGSLAIIGIALLVALVIFVPQLYYTVFPAQTVPIEAATQGTPLGGNFDLGAETALKEKTQTQERYLPPQDDSLPAGDWIIIPRIGVRTELQKTYDVEAALETGVLWEPDYGQPGDLNIPMIVVAHRFGYKWWWKSDYWKYHSFYLLPELEPGDLVEVISDHRKWTYEIYAGEEGEEVSDYEADMILYTCKYLNSSIRHFRYARIINMNTDSQAS